MLEMPDVSLSNYAARLTQTMTLSYKTMETSRFDAAEADGIQHNQDFSWIQVESFSHLRELRVETK